MTVAISLERYLGICHENIKFKRKLLIYTVPVLLISSTLSTPDIYDASQHIENGSINFDKNISRLESKHWIFFESFGIRTLIPTIAIVILNVAVWIRIRKAKRIWES